MNSCPPEGLAAPAPRVTPCRVNVNKIPEIVFFCYIIWWVSPAEQELLTLPVDPRFLVRFLVLYACFVDRCLFFCTSFSLCVVCSSSVTDSDYPSCIFKLFFSLLIIIYIQFALLNLTMSSFVLLIDTQWSYMDRKHKNTICCS